MLSLVRTGHSECIQVLLEEEELLEQEPESCDHQFMTFRKAKKQICTECDVERELTDSKQDGGSNRDVKRSTLIDYFLSTGPDCADDGPIGRGQKRKQGRAIPHLGSIRSGPRLDHLFLVCR
jgi:hypothetical protein